eukprot:gb/GECH01012517.1/.p1 GENE.gb/GECH01012517.1/~~gb/GECH01012517.1/.p1  ORF type:complete len:409 (+),score=95.68 gb/GECH01012517.1/:1-1227(+)
MSSLHESAKSGDLSELKNHLTEKNINSLDENNTTALYWACEKGHLEIVKTLLNVKDVNVNLANPKDWTPLQVAAYYGYPEIVEQLLTRGDIRIYATDRIGNNVLHFCIDGKSPRHIESVRHILRFQREKISNPETFVELQKNNKNISPFYCACYNGLLDTTRVILEETTRKHDCLFHRNGQMESTGFAMCCYEGYFELVKYLLSENDELMRIQDKYGFTPIIDALRRNHKNIAEYLIPQLSAVDLQRHAEKKKTVLHYAIELEYKDIIAMILRNPYVNINLTDDDGNTPLHYAASRSGDLVKLLLSYPRTEKPNLSLKNNDDKTALDIAVASNNAAGVQHMKTEAQCPLWVLQSLHDIHGAIDTVPTAGESSLSDAEQEMLQKIRQRGEKRKMKEHEDAPPSKQNRTE